MKGCRVFLPFYFARWVMNKFIIKKSDRLCGEIFVQGSKNSVLPILAATVLTDSETVLHNCPDLSDVSAALSILEGLGCTVKREGHTLTVNSEGVNSSEISDSLMTKMRSSVMFLGAILGRTGKAVLTTPGGCDIGLRPIDIHIDAVKRLGVRTEREREKLMFFADGGLKGANIYLPFPSVGATENILLASCLAKGKTVIYNAAKEPEINDLARFLICAGAKINFRQDGAIEVEGVKKLHGTQYTVMPDRIAAGSYLLSAAATGGKLKVCNLASGYLGALIPVLCEMGCEVSEGEKSISLSAPDRLNCTKTVRTLPYPGFPTDLQAPLCAALLRAKGTSMIVENIFEARFKHIPELVRLGAKIQIQGRAAVIRGVDKLSANRLKAYDLRGGFSLIIAALQAQGKSEISCIGHIDRGYEAPEKVLSMLGADIKRIEDNGRK